LLEGPETQVQAAIECIGSDDRHVGVQTRSSGKADSRIFTDCAMHHDPETSLIWTEEELSDGILDRATAEEIKDKFVALAENVKKNGPPT